jgi:hypothetical protein
VRPETFVAQNAAEPRGPTGAARCSVAAAARPRPGQRGLPRSARVVFGILTACLACSAGAAESVSPEAAEDARILVENAVAVGRARLAKEGAFHPFGFLMSADGRVQRLSPKDDAALPSPADVLVQLEQVFRERALAGDCRAIAVVADVVIALPGGGQSDALQVGIEHQAGYCADFFHPYERGSDGTIRFLEPISSERKGVVFPACRP